MRYEGFERLLTMKEATQALGVSTQTLQRWDREGKIKVVRTLGGRRRIPESEIKRLLGAGGKTEIIVCKWHSDFVKEFKKAIKEKYGELGLEECMKRIVEEWLERIEKEQA